MAEDETNNKSPKPRKADPKLEVQKINPPRVSIADLLAQSPAPQDMKNKQNEHRVMAITQVARVDDSLVRLLKMVLTPSNHDADDLLDEGMVIGTLGLRAKLCLRLGLISPALYRLIKDLSDIRNECSHKPIDFDVFADQPTQDKINSIWNRLNSELFKPTIKDTRHRFEEICGYINIVLRVTTNESPSKNFINSEIIFKK
jgi:DNA-binding MltR family transcriptional regulator